MRPKNRKQRQQPKGFFGIGIENTYSEMNIGTLWRTAFNMGASFIFTIGKRYKKQSTDTTKAHLSIPLFQYTDIDDFLNCSPKDCKIIGIEIDDKAESLCDYTHFERSIYLLGAEDQGLSKRALECCHDLVFIPSKGCLNVAVTGSIIIYDRLCKSLKKQ